MWWRRSIFLFEIAPARSFCCTRNCQEPTPGTKCDSFTGVAATALKMTLLVKDNHWEIYYCLTKKQ